MVNIATKNGDFADLRGLHVQKIIKILVFRCVFINKRIDWLWSYTGITMTPELEWFDIVKIIISINVFLLFQPYVGLSENRVPHSIHRFTIFLSHSAPYFDCTIPILVFNHHFFTIVWCFFHPAKPLDFIVFLVNHDFVNITENQGESLRFCTWTLIVHEPRCIPVLAKRRDSMTGDLMVI